MRDDTFGTFYTQAGYAKMDEHTLTPAAEDYLEMIWRLSKGGTEPVRVGELSECLHVSPSSASRMASFMSGVGYVNFKRYGYITLTDAGLIKGDYLIRRHNTVNKFLCSLKSSEDETRETEKIEHFLSEETVEAMERRLMEDEAARLMTDQTSRESEKKVMMLTPEAPVKPKEK